MKERTLVMVMCAGIACATARAEDTAKPADVPKTSGTPKIQFDHTVYDIGTTSPVHSVTGRFIFKNAGDGVLQVQKPSTTCGCTVANISPDSYKPGEQGELSFTVNLSNARGAFQKQITVPSNDPQNPRVTLTVKAEVKPICEVTPTQLSLGDIKQGETGKATVQVTRLDGKKLAITKTEAPQDFIALNATVQPVESSPDHAARITIEGKAGHQPRRFSDKLWVYTGDSSEPALLIPITGRVLGDVVVQPEALTWMIQDPASWPGANPGVAIRRVKVSATRGNAALELRNAASDLDGLSVELVPAKSDNTYEIVAKLTKPPKGSTQAVIRFETNVPTQPKVEVPVMITVMKLPSHKPAEQAPAK